MPYRIKRSDDGVEKAVRRIGAEQIQRAIKEIDDRNIDIDETIHQVRKRCKKVRGLIRLVRPGFSAYSDENGLFRDAAKALSGLRDAKTIIETYDRLVEHFDHQIERRAFASIRQRLTLRYKERVGATDVERELAQFRDTMVGAHERVAKWTLEDDGYEAASGGLGKTYKRARKAMAAAFKTPTPQAMHDWRKRVKYHWYHARLLQALRPAMIAPHIVAADQLSELLGDHHDLAVLRKQLEAEPGQFGSSADIDAFFGLIERRQKTFEDDAFALGRILLAEKHKALVGRWNEYWDVWQEKGTNSNTILAA